MTAVDPPRGRATLDMLPEHEAPRARARPAKATTPRRPPKTPRTQGAGDARGPSLDRAAALDSPVAEGERTIASNRKARHEYHILERLETGIALTGTEVKSLRAGKVALREAYAQERGGELWLVGATIEPYEQGNRANHEPTRDRKLLAHKHEIEELASRVAEKGLTLIPLRLYFKDGRVKAEIALARGKEGIDKRRALADRDVRREIDRELKTRFRG